LDFLSDQRHYADSGQDMLPIQPLSRHTVVEVLLAVDPWLAQVTHEEGGVSLECPFGFALDVADKPLRLVSVRGGLKQMIEWIYLERSSQSEIFSDLYFWRTFKKVVAF
jgi:hypothetical protein